jgi:hypothetical protein
MCRNIKTLFNFEPPVTEAEVRAAALQYVRKVSGFNKPSSTLLSTLETNAPPRDRAIEIVRARARSETRFPKGEK